MPRRFQPPPVLNNHPNVTPLIDVVMCLIIFYMLVAKIGITTGADESIRIPQSTVGTDLRDPGNALTLNIRPGPGGQPQVSALIGRATTDLPVTIAPGSAESPLVLALRRLRLGPDLTPGTADDNPELKVILRADENMPYSAIEPVLMACAQAAVRNVSFNTRKAAAP